MSAFKTYFKEQFYWRMLFLEHSKPSDFYLSCWQATRSSVPLLIFRLFLFLFAVGIVLYSSILYMISGVFMFWFIYLTHWGLSLIVLTTGFAVAVSARCYLCGPITAGAEFSLPWYVIVYWVLYNIAVPLAFLVTVFYWALLYDAGIEEELNHGLDVAVHGLNSVLMFLLLASSSHPSRLMHFYQPLLLGAVYMLFGLFFYLAGGVDQNGNPWIYSVVDWSNPGTTIGLLAITGVLLVLLQCLTVAIAAGRDALTNALIKPSVTVHIDEGLPLRQPLGGPRD